MVIGAEGQEAGIGAEGEGEDQGSVIAAGIVVVGIEVADQGLGIAADQGSAIGEEGGSGYCH